MTYTLPLLQISNKSVTLYSTCQHCTYQRKLKYILMPTNTKKLDRRQQKHEDINFVDSIFKLRRTCGFIVNNIRFKTFITILIVGNAVTMGLATYPFVRENPQNNLIFEHIDFTLLIIYTIESLLQFIYHGFGLFMNGWLLLSRMNS